MNRIAAISVLLLASLSLGLCGARPIPYGGELTIAVAPPPEVDPARVSSASEMELAALAHETLFQLGGDGEAVPALARDAHPSDDFREWTIRLRIGECFHNGSPLEARDVMQSWERLIRRETASPYWWLLSMVDGALEYRQGRIRRLRGVEASNRATIKVRLTRSFPDFPEALASLPVAVLPSSWIAKRGPADPPGAGPFSRVPSLPETAELRPFLRHVAGRPFLERLFFRAPVSPEVLRALGTPASSGEDREAQIPSAPAGAWMAPERWPVFLVRNPRPTRRWPAPAHSALLALLNRGALAEVIPAGSTPDGEAGDTRAAQDPDEARRHFANWTAKRWGLPPLAVLLIHPDEAQRALAAELREQAARLGIVLAIQEKRHDDFAGTVAGGDWDLRLEEVLPVSQDEELRALQMADFFCGEDALRNADAQLRKLPPGEERVALLGRVARECAQDAATLLLMRSFRYVRPAEIENLRFRGPVWDLSSAWIRVEKK